MNQQEILQYFQEEQQQEIQKHWTSSKNLEEIHIRVEKPIILKFSKQEIITNIKVKQEEILQILQHICNNSIYAYQNQICEGFITIKGGHRIGITGSIVITEGKITNIKYISSLNFRISRQIIGCSEKILQDILNYSKNTIYNTLIVSNPGARKNNIIKRLYKENK